MKRLTSILSIALVAALASYACGPSVPKGEMPVLPGDGDDNVVKPGDGGDVAAKADDPWAGRTDLIQTPAAQPPVEVKLPPIQRFTLKNGLEVIVVENHDLPVVGMQLAIKSGWGDETREKRGLADFAASMLTQGTKKRTAEQIAETIDFVGGSLGANAGFEGTFTSCQVLSKDLATCLQLLPDVVINPTFPESEMGKVRDQLISAVRQRRDDPAQLASVHFQNELWGDGNVRGWPMTARSIEAIKRADLVAWHKAQFKPNNAVLAIAGDVDVAKLKKQLDAAFRSWRKGEVAAHPSYDEPNVRGIRVRLVDKDDQTQSQIRIGHLGISHRDPDFYATVVMNYTLGGGGFSSRLMQAVRSDEGKTYGAGSSFDLNLTRGAFGASTFTRNAETVATIRIMLDEIAKMQKAGPTEPELADAKTNIAGRWPLRFESASDIAGALLGAELHGFDDDYVRKYAVRMGAVTAADAKRAAADRLDASNLVIVIVGAAKDVAPLLDKTGWKYEVVSADDPIAKVDREALSGGGEPVSAADEKQAREILDAALTAKGGEKKLAGVETMKIEGAASLVIQGRPLNAAVTRVWKRPSSLRLDLVLDTPMGKVDMTTVVTPTAGWQRQAMGANAQVAELSKDDLGDAAVQLWRDAEFILLRHKDKGTVVRPLADEDVDGKPHKVVQVTRADGKASVKLFLDAKTRLLTKMTYAEGGEEAVESFSDYKKIQGIQVAHTRNSKSPQGTFDTVLSSVELNGKVDASAFDKPAN